MPFSPDIGAKDYETFKQEFAERIIEKWAKYAPNMTRRNIIAQHVYTAREYTQHFPEMRNGDIFMGAFNAEQVMYNHFGYRTPIERLYMAGSATHPGGAISGGGGYISAGVSLLAGSNCPDTWGPTGFQGPRAVPDTVFLAELNKDRAGFNFDFFFLMGDANRDKHVDTTDFNVLAANFGKSGRTFTQGNFSYDAGGLVNTTDFNLLASKFAAALPALARPGSMPSPTKNALLDELS